MASRLIQEYAVRTKDKIRTIEAATDEEGNIFLEVETKLDGTEFQTLNWKQVGRALELMIDDDMMEEHRGDAVQKLTLEK